MELKPDAGLCRDRQGMGLIVPDFSLVSSINQ